MDKFELDYRRGGDINRSKIRKLISVYRDSVLKGIYYARLSEKVTNVQLAAFFTNRSIKNFKKTGIEVGNLKNVEGGICFVHAYGITINPRAHIGKDFTIFKGATVGSVRSGARGGVPTIGDRVTVCSNAFVCGGITIGSDVLIAANAFVNMDVPSNSIVVGNPGVIHMKQNPSKDYLPDTSTINK